MAMGGGCHDQPLYAHHHQRAGGDRRLPGAVYQPALWHRTVQLPGAGHGDGMNLCFNFSFMEGNHG